MPKIVDFQHADDRRDIVHDVVRALAEGRLVGLPTETSYTVAGLAAHPEMASRLNPLVRGEDVPGAAGRGPVLAVKGAAEVLDYLAQPGPLARKLLKRFWPGPVTFVFPAPLVDGLIDALPRSTRETVLASGSLAVRAPGGEAISAVLRLLPGPLVIAPEAADLSTEGASSAQELADRFPDQLALVLDAGSCRHAMPTSVVRVDRERWHLDREGVVTQRTLARLAGQLYLFVCTGNTCRSPMAEGLFRKLLAERLQCSEDELLDRGYFVASAGVAAGSGSPPSPEAVEVLERRGVDIRGHESQPLTPQLVAQADRIFTMTRGHRDVLLHEFPEAAGSVDLLAPNGADVIDPLGAGFAEYQKCALEIEQHLRSIVQALPDT